MENENFRRFNYRSAEKVYKEVYAVCHQQEPHERPSASTS
ncbi:MAG: hypothetical protein ACLTDS_10625 [Bianqueaceae bacterium]